MKTLRLHSANAYSLHALWLHSLVAMALLAGAVLASLSSPAMAQAPTADEYEIRAAMLFNLTKFVVWPTWKLDAAHPQLLMCILGKDPVGPYADHYLQNQNAGGKPVQIRHLNTLDGASSCHILYFSASERKNAERELPELMKSGVLTVSERSNATSPNQVIGLPTLDDHVHIDVNLGAAQRTGLTISSKLLRLATVTH